MLKKLLVLCVLSFVVMTVCHADSIVLKSGKQMEGTITERSKDSIKINISDGVAITYYLDEIATINGEKVVINDAQTPAPAVTQSVPATSSTEGSSVKPALTVPETVTKKEPDQPVPAASGSAQSISEHSQGISTSTTKIVEPDAPVTSTRSTLPESLNGPSGRRHIGVTSSSNLNMPKSAALRGLVPAAAALTILPMMGTVLMVIFLFGIASYVFFSICLVVIAKKTNAENAWFAWIPIANLFLMCRIGGVPYTWIFILFAAFIPFGGLIVGAFGCYLWYKIAIVRNKPGWLGILTFLPIINFVVVGYIAFTE